MTGAYRRQLLSTQCIRQLGNTRSKTILDSSQSMIFQPIRIVLGLVITQRATIKGLPTEILYNVFQQVSGDESTNNQVSVKSIRQVSQQFNTVSSALLVKSVTARMTSRSLSRLEEICQHPEFRKGITHVTIDTSYYDRKLAADRRQYASHCGHVLSYFGDIEDRSSFAGAYARGEEQSQEAEHYVSDLFQMSDELSRISALGFQNPLPTKTEQHFNKIHQEYARRSKDQEEVRQGDNHIRRVCACLRNLSALEHLTISDVSYKIGKDIKLPINGDDKSSRSHKTMERLSMEKSGWNGSFETAYTTEPPVEMLGDLLSQLGRSDVRPRHLEIYHNTPSNMRILQVTETQAEGIHRLVSQASDIEIRFTSLDRKGSFAENNDRSREEMLAMGSLFKALTTTSSLQSLKVGFDRYPVFYQHPTADLSDLLPIRTVTWPRLERVEFHDLPFEVDDLSTFVSRHRDSVKEFEGNHMYLRTGDWKSVLDVLRDSNALEKVDILYPQGRQYCDRELEFPQEEAEEYVLGKKDENPLEES